MLSDEVIKSIKNQVEQSEYNDNDDIIQNMNKILSSENPRQVFYSMQSTNPPLYNILNFDTVQDIVREVHAFEDDNIGYASKDPVRDAPFCHGTTDFEAEEILKNGLRTRMSIGDKLSPQNMEDPLLASYFDRVYLGNSTYEGLLKCFEASKSYAESDATLLFFGKNVGNLDTIYDEDCIADSELSKLSLLDDPQREAVFIPKSARQSGTECGSFAVRESISPKYIETIDDKADGIDKKMLYIHEEGSMHRLCTYLVSQEAFIDIDECFESVRAIMDESDMHYTDDMFDDPYLYRHQHKLDEYF